MVRVTQIATLLVGLAALVLVTASAQATHPRPKGATPLRVALVPAYVQCAASNRTHGPPLAFPSCNPPAQTSAQATVGTPDAYGGAANSTGSLRLTAWRGAPAAVDPADLLIDLSVNDVRCVPSGTRCGTANAAGPDDYSGELRFSFTFRLTDHFNASAPGGGTDPATVEDFMAEFSWPCAQSGSSTGSTCNLNTGLNAVLPCCPDAVLDGKRGIWALDAVRIFDGGADGDGDTTADNTVFMRPGIFVP